MDPDLLQHMLRARRLQSQAIANAIAAAFRLFGRGCKVLGYLALAPFRAVLRSCRRSMALEELRSIEPRILKDTGLYRGELWSIADAYARGVPYDRGSQCKQPLDDLNDNQSESKEN